MRPRAPPVLGRDERFENLVRPASDAQRRAQPVEDVSGYARPVAGHAAPDVVVQLTNRHKLLGISIGDFKLKRVLDLHDQLNGVQTHAASLYVSGY